MDVVGRAMPASGTADPPRISVAEASGELFAHG